MRLLFPIILLLNTFISWSQTIQQDEKNIKRNIQLGDEAKLANEYEKAVSYYKLGATISKKYKSAFVDELMTCYSNQAFCEYMLGDYENATRNYRANLTFIEKKHGRNSIMFAFDLYLLAACEKALQHSDVAIGLYEEAKAIFKTKFGIYDINYANCFLRQAEIHSYFPDKKNKLKASENFEFYLNFEKDRGKTTEPYRTYLFSHGLNFMELNFLYSLEQKKDSAAIYLNKAKESYREIYKLESDSKKPNFESVKSTLSQLAKIDISEEKYSLALKKYKKIIEIENKNNPGITSDKIYYLSEMGDTYLKIKNFKKASKIEKEISNEKEQLKKCDPQKQLLILSNIASYYNKTEKFNEEISIRKEILSLQNKVNPTVCNKYSALEHALIGQAYNKIEKGDSVFNNLQKSKEITACAFGKQHAKYVEIVLRQTLYTSFYQYNAVDEQRLLGLFAELDSLEKIGLLTPAELNNVLLYKQEFYQKRDDVPQLLALKRKERTSNMSITNEENLTLLILEAENLAHSGQTTKAYELCKKLLTSYPNMDKYLLRKLLRCSVTLPLLAENDLNESYRLACWSVDLHNDKSLWESDKNNIRNYLSEVSLLSTFLIRMDKTAEAIKLINKNLDVGKMYLEENDNSLYTFYYTLGFLYFKEDKYQEAIFTIKKAQSFDIKLNRTDDPLYILSLKQIAYCYLFENQNLKADSLMTEHLLLELNKTNNNILKFTESDLPYRKIDAIISISEFINYAVLRYNQNPSLLTLAVNKWLFFNDLQKRTSIQHSTYKSVNEESVNDYKKNQDQISKVLQLPKNVRESENLNLEDLIIDRRKIETQIRNESESNTSEPSLELIQNHLGANQNYLLIIPYTHRNMEEIVGPNKSPFTGKQFYLIACVNKEKGMSDFQIIENAEDLENDYYEEYKIYINNQTDQQTTNTIVFENYFKPIERFFESKRTFICAAGIYNDINLEAVNHPAKKDLLINLFDFQYVTPNKYDFNEQNSIDLKKVSLFGDIDFGDGISKAIKQNEMLKEFGVIGINTSISESNNINIDKVELGLPAELVGLKVQDKIIEIDGEEVDLEKNKLSYYLGKVRGPALTQVNLKVLRPESNSTLSFSITRAQTVLATPKIEFKNLPGTKDEVNSIAEILKRKNISTLVYTKQEANELNLKKTENIDILHIATHSFFIEPYNIANSTFVGILENEFSVSPFLFNGLALADVNNFFYPEMTLNKENGFVNGLEISLLNLKETELVIISGCESGKATYGIGESKFGFKEALFRAGVKNVILSDYNIDDKATADFYSIFYTILTDKKMSVEETLKATKKEMQKKYKHPYYWAAFQLYTN